MKSQFVSSVAAGLLCMAFCAAVGLCAWKRGDDELLQTAAILGLIGLFAPALGLITETRGKK